VNEALFINARADTIRLKPALREAFDSAVALIAADSFFEPLLPTEAQSAQRRSRRIGR
jgi:putative SOS response-associated peptidase YedK